MVREPDPLLRLLWRHQLPDDQPRAAPRRGRRQQLSVDQVVATAIDLADHLGLAKLSMRTLAERLGLGTMSLYTYLPGRDELLVLMVDQVWTTSDRPALPDDLRARWELLARTEYADLRAHPWILEADEGRPWLGPGAVGRYEWQLSALDGLGLDDIEMDQTVTLLTGFAASIVRGEQRLRRSEQASGMTEAQWWEANAAELARVTAGHEHPLADRVGSAAGAAYQAATDPARQLDFGLARIVDGLLAHIGRAG